MGWRCWCICFFNLFIYYEHFPEECRLSNACQDKDCQGQLLQAFAHFPHALVDDIEEQNAKGEEALNFQQILLVENLTVGFIQIGEYRI